MKNPKKNSQQAFTLIELILYLGLMTTALIVLVQFDILTRRIASLQIAQLEVIKSAKLVMREMTKKIRQAQKVDIDTKGCVLYLKNSVVSFVWDPQEQVLREEERNNTSKKNSKKSSLVLGLYIKSFQCQKKQGENRNFIQWKIQWQCSENPDYILTLERKIALKQTIP